MTLDCGSLLPLFASQPAAGGAGIERKIRNPPDSPRHTGLPDDAAGIFHPGWDVGLTFNSVFEHLINDTLGSPFPEDVKLCAAISSYWPGVVPDALSVRALRRHHAPREGP